LWMTPDEILQAEPRWRSPSVQTCIADFQAGVRYPLDLIRHLAPSR